MQSLVAYNVSVLEKIDQLLLQLNDDEMARPSDLLFGSSVGQHCRHILEFYECLLGHVREGSFSYDRRRRNLLIETEVTAARASAVRSISLLQELREDKVMAMESELPGSKDMSSQMTTLKRELAYLADHGVHHLAMIRIALEQELAHVAFPEHLGVAASTRNFRQR
ncbi:MAG: hypothetical protein IPK99_16315 [Flavobacteriales bacterium]|nr:hypothetical protein [Flavobacteriales bacterium]